MGTPDFAVPSLEILLENGYEVVAVVTVADKLGGRGHQLLQSPVKKFAISKGLPVLQPTNLKSQEFQEELRSYHADLQVIVAFRMLPKAVWSMPKIGSINLHGSLLPKYRGAAPINWAIIEGEKETGVTTFFLQHEIDTGDILFQEKIPIGENETAGELHDRMMHLGAGVILKTVQTIERGDYVLQKQSDAEATKAPKIFHETCEINFHQSTQKVHDFIRGLSPYPAAWTVWQAAGDGNGLVLKIFKTIKELASHEHAPGTVMTDRKKFLKIATGDGYVQVLECQLEGRRRMGVVDFLNGWNAG